MLHCHEGFIIAILTITQLFFCCTHEISLSYINHFLARVDKHCLFLESHESFSLATSRPHHID